VTGRILILDDDRAFRLSTAALLREEGHVVEVAGVAQEAMDLLSGGGFDLLIVDLRMPGVDGIQLAEILRLRGESTPILMVSGFGTVDSAVRALQNGVDDFLTKPVEPDVLCARVEALLARRPRQGHPRSAPSGTHGSRALGRLVGRCEAMRMLREAILSVSPTSSSVLILGETGTGKELVARAIHEGSPRRNGPFVAVNAAALSDGLLESELFGHVKGAFTGAVGDRQGFFQAAHGGTLFLDEIGDIPPSVQRRLLRVLQEKEVMPLGTSRPIPVDVRIVAATNRNLGQSIRNGEFREDLYYRLNVFRLEIPSLRERPGDIPLLVEAFLTMQECGKRPGDGTCSPLAARALRAYPWPGNVRELFATLEGALIRSGGARIEAQHLPPEVRDACGHRGPLSPRTPLLLDDPFPRRPRWEPTLGSERASIVAALEDAGGVKARAAELLGMGRTTLWRKMKELQISA
jgi:DNA-binding NtrC family response regulator